MNERIKELMLEAGYAAPEIAGRANELAELIIRECARVAIFKDDGMIATAEVSGYMAAGRSTAARLIKQHFGVEE